LLLIDLERESDTLEIDGDVCIVGAGAVGLVLAVDLARKGVRVGLHRGVSVGRAPFANVKVGRYRVRGGTTTFSGGQVVPFSPHIFEHRPWVTGAVWPFGLSTSPLFPKGLPDDRRGVGLAGRSAVWKRLALEAPDLDPAHPMDPSA
jgi:glycine/D-amino acid oxidase-like deaminating enzyme